MAMIDLLAFGLVAMQPSADCANAQSQLAMNVCAGEAFDRADAELNAVWREVIADARSADAEFNRDNAGNGSRPMDSEAQLRAAQRAWVTFRDAQCSYESYESFGGSMEPMLYEECRARLTLERIAQLRGQPEGAQ